MKRVSHRKAFSLIELLVVIALIGILSTLLIIGIGKLRTSSKRQQTQLTMQNLTAMFADYDSNRRVPFGMGHISYSSMAGTEKTNMLNAIYLAAPGNVSTDGSDRTGTIVQLTRDFMGQLMQYPSNAAAIGKMGAGSVMTFATVYPTASNGDWTAGTVYPVYSSVTLMGDTSSPKNVYYRTQVYTDPALVPYGTIQQGDIAQNAPPNSYFWIPALPVPSPTLPLSIPVLLDGWGNPIIFVMGGVLGAPTSATTGQLTAGGNVIQIHSSDFRPFFASAGPDGDFSKGDDNIYSFEK